MATRKRRKPAKKACSSAGATIGKVGGRRKGKTTKAAARRKAGLTKSATSFAGGVLQSCKG